MITDPPPPYPSRERHSRTARSNHGHHGRLQTSHHTPTSSGNNDEEHEARMASYTDDQDVGAENTPFLASRTSHARHGHHGVTGRPRSHSHTSTTSVAPSLAHTVLSLFQTEEEVYLSDGIEDMQFTSSGDENGNMLLSQRHGPGLFSRAAWRRYFRPMTRQTYYGPLVHLLVINLPYALAAWVYLFVFTVTGTTLLVALPLGAVLCFFNLLGARAFSRGELALQTRFHSSLAHPPPYPPRPIFTRYREPTTSELESSSPQQTRTGLVREKSFYKNSYAMFTDPTSYQALFYFLVIKPAITLLISLGLIIFGLPLILLILPAPAVLRAVRKIGIWQANVAVEGLYLAVR
ncbi:hypothetical protein B0H34DRAFT_667610 [Crassisporium funariophilum]|nr:hypothetical protein B0H34DRAFT_667610 [Crassisporium funariophilum]